MKAALLATALLPLAHPPLQERPAPPPRPRLVVVLVFDQLRPDHLTRFQDLFLPPHGEGGAGGFRWLLETGASFPNARHAHVPTDTGPGHATLSTGAGPSVHGIVGNSWFDRESRQAVRCTDDPGSRAIPGGGPGASPRLLQVPTLGDELKRAAGGRSRVVSLSFKDRAAVLMAGRHADDVLWLRDGHWTTSTWFAPDGRLPPWAEERNGRRLPLRDLGRKWERALPEDAHRRARAPENPTTTDSFGEDFPHSLPQREGSAFWREWLRTPFANDFLFASARAAVAARGLGAGPAPDLLWLGVSPHDYLGHAFGPDSPQVMELTVAADRQLAAFFRFLEEHVPGGLESVLVVLTSDHGVQAIPEELVRDGLPGGRVSPAHLRRTVDQALEAAFGAADLLAHAGSWMAWIDLEACRRRGLEAAAVEEVVAGALRALPEVHSTYTRTRVLDGRLGGGWLDGTVRRSFHTQRSGDVWFFLRPGWLATARTTGTTHGSPWVHDAAVPLVLRGAWVEPGVHPEPSTTADLAPTLAAALGIPAPGGSTGRVLRPARSPGVR